MNDYTSISNVPFQPTMWASSHSSPEQAWSSSSSDASNYEDIFNNDWDFTVDNTALLQPITTHMAYPDMPAMNLQLSNTSFDSTRSKYDMLDQSMNRIERTISPIQNPTTSSNRSEQRRERRRIQNRNSQRQYRARKEGLLTQYSQRIAELENEVKQYQSANHDLTKLIQTLRNDQDRATGTTMKDSRPT